MKPINRTISISLRVIKQITNDPRSTALIIIAPLIVTSLIGFSFIGQKEILNKITPALLGVIVFFFSFLVTGVSFLRERIEGTLERLLLLPIKKVNVITGYLFGFLILTTVQTLIVLTYIIFVFDQSYNNISQVLVILMLVTTTSVSLGIFVSTFARNEFQVIQFIPLIILPQIFLSGIFIPVNEMPQVLQLISEILPLKHAVFSLSQIMLHGKTLNNILPQLFALLGFASVCLVAGMATIKNRS